MNHEAHFENLITNYFIDNPPSSFEPSIFIFNNAVLITYKKVGTRFFEIISTENISNVRRENSKFLDTFWKLSPRESDKNIVKLNDIYTQEVSIKTGFDYDENFSFYYKTLDNLFKQEEVSGFQELLFENSKKDIILVIRNPVVRFFSGLIQVLLNISITAYENEPIQEHILKYSGVSPDELKKFIKNFKGHLNNQTTNSELEIIVNKLINYCLHHNFHDLAGDIHTQNFLSGYIDIVNTIKDKSKLKIIDLSELNSENGLKFLSNLRGDDLLSNYFKEQGFINRNSNSIFYENIINSVLKNPKSYTLVINWLKIDIANYLKLKKSPYFVKIV